MRGDHRDVLNLGCGAKKMKDAVNVDRSSAVEPDLVANLDVYPWPLETDAFSEIHAYDVIEHLSDVVATLEEIHRIGRPGARVHLTVPHFSSANAFTDPTHRHAFGWRSLDYFTGGHEHGHYSDRRFALEERQMLFQPRLVNRVVRPIATRFPERYEERWAWMFPAWFLYFQLSVIKG